MITEYYHMDGCPHCIETTKLFNTLNWKPDFSTERKKINLSDRMKYDIKLYPTLVFLSDDKNFLGKVEGQLDQKTLKNAIEKYSKLS